MVVTWWLHGGYIPRRHAESSAEGGGREGEGTRDPRRERHALPLQKCPPSRRQVNLVEVLSEPP